VEGAPTPRARQILAAAADLLESEGPDGLSMRRIAARLGMRAPSLYKHFPDKRAIEDALVSEGFLALAARFDETAPGADPVAAVAATYRAFARARPHLYRLMTARPLDRAALAAGAEEAAAGHVVRAFGGDADLARAAWAFAHGMTILELDGRFPPDADLDAAWRRGIEALRP
jgi:AcrR family transcriptional regulator